MRLSTRVIGIGITVFLLGSILLLMAFGLWKTEGTKVSAKFTSGEFSGRAIRLISEDRIALPISKGISQSLQLY
jgi:hypothetical protein